jgi:hypothetical protein
MPTIKFRHLALVSLAAVTLAACGGDPAPAPAPDPDEVADEARAYAVAYSEAIDEAIMALVVVLDDVIVDDGQEEFPAEVADRRADVRALLTPPPAPAGVSVNPLTESVLVGIEVSGGGRTLCIDPGGETFTTVLDGPCSNDGDRSDVVELFEVLLDGTVDELRSYRDTTTDGTLALEAESFDSAHRALLAFEFGSPDPTSEADLVADIIDESFSPGDILYIPGDPGQVEFSRNGQSVCLTLSADPAVSGDVAEGPCG